MRNGLGGCANLRLAMSSYRSVLARDVSLTVNVLEISAHCLKLLNVQVN